MNDFPSVSWRKQVAFWWDYDDVYLLLDQHPQLDYYSASCSLKQQSARRHVAPHGHIILLPNQLVFVLATLCWLFSGEAIKYKFYSLWFDPVTESTLWSHSIRTRLQLPWRCGLNEYVISMNAIIVDLLCEN
jgi:hypothetical protein